MPGMAKNETKRLTEMAQIIEHDIRAIRKELRRPLDAEYQRTSLTGPQTTVMRAVYFSDGLSLKEVCHRVGLSHSTVSGIVDRLEARGLLVRSVNTDDRRYSIIAVSSAVREFVQKKVPGIIAQPLVHALKKASPSERNEILKGLDILRRVLGLIKDQAPGPRRLKP
jgi:MarR family transcriptional regulator, organic hydroperoxide resistance regulator